MEYLVEERSVLLCCHSYGPVVLKPSDYRGKLHLAREVRGTLEPSKVPFNGSGKFTSI